MKSDATPEKFDEFKRAAEPLCHWFRNNLNPHDAIVITSGQVKIVSDQMSIPFEDSVV